MKMTEIRVSSMIMLVAALFCLLVFSNIVSGSDAITSTVITSGRRIMLAWFNATDFYQRFIPALHSLNDPKRASFKSDLEKIVNIAMTNLIKARLNAERALCNAHRRLIHGAILMYQMDKEKNSFASGPIDLDKLRSGPYLKGDISCPCGGVFTLTAPLDEGGEVSCSIHGSTKKPLLAEVSASSTVSLAEVVRQILEFDSKNILRPTGGLWAGIDSQNGFGILLEANCKPNAFFDLVASLSPYPLPKPDEQTAEEIIFRFPSPGHGLPAATLRIAKSGIFLDAFREKGVITPSGSCEEIVGLTSEKTNEFVFELEGAFISQVFKSSYAYISDLVKSSLQKLTRVRGVFDRNSCRLSAEFSDSKTIHDLMPKLKQQIDLLKPSIDKILVEQMQGLPLEAQAGFESMRRAIESLTVTSDDDWLTINVPTPTEEASFGIVVAAGMFAAIAIPNYAKARENIRNTACQANMRVILGALQLDTLYSGKPPVCLDFQDLKSKKLIREIPVCPEGGSYSAYLEPNGKDFQINCTIHGPLRR